MDEPDSSYYDIVDNCGCYICTNEMERYQADLAEWTRQQKIKNDKFWMVTGPNNRPTVRHPTQESAEAEAGRLATKHPGEKFFVLQAVASNQAVISLAPQDIR